MNRNTLREIIEDVLCGVIVSALIFTVLFIVANLTAFF
jgi:hypothetical protein